MPFSSTRFRKSRTRSEPLTFSNCGRNTARMWTSTNWRRSWWSTISYRVTGYGPRLPVVCDLCSAVRGSAPQEAWGLSCIALGFRMLFELPEHHRALQASIRAFCEERVKPFAGEWDKTGQFPAQVRSEEHTSELQSRQYLEC